MKINKLLTMLEIEMMSELDKLKSGKNILSKAKQLRQRTIQNFGETFTEISLETETDIEKYRKLMQPLKPINKIKYNQLKLI